EKADSREDGGGRGNLVLSYAGVKPVADRILNVEERKPRVGVLVVHEALSTEGDLNIYSLSGLRKALTAHGFDVRDVVLKRWGGAVTPAVDRLDDTKRDRLLDERDALDDDIKARTAEIKALEDLVKDWPDGQAAQLGERLTEYAQTYDRSIYRMPDILVRIDS